MKADNNNSRLDQLLRSAIGKDCPPFNFERWKQEHSRQIQESRTEIRSRRAPQTLLVRRRGKISRGLRIAIAVTILLTVLIVVSRFIPPLDGTAAAYARVTQAVRNVPWMHIRYTGYRLDKEGNKMSKEGDLDTEIWYSFNTQVVIQRYHGGCIIYNDYARQEVHEYNSVSKRVIVSALSVDGWPFQADSPWTWLERNIQRMTPMGGEVTRRTGQYQRQEVEIFEIASALTPPISAIRAKIFVDRASSLPIAEERTGISADTGKLDLVETGTFDYPEHGPADIYALGLSRDIPTINSLPLPPWREISGAYQSRHYRAPVKRYIAVVTHHSGILGSPINVVDVFYADGSLCREEHHLVFHDGGIGEQWPGQAAELGTTLDSILKWSRAYRASGEIFIHLYDRRNYYGCQRDDQGSWSTTNKPLPKQLVDNDFWNTCPVADLGWPEIRDAADIVQDDYAREHHLIRVETPKDAFYLDPNRDYICQKRISLAEGRVREVTEFGQTKEGRWYPRKVKDGNLPYTIYLETPPELPEGIFDPNRLPKATRNLPH